MSGFLMGAVVHVQYRWPIVIQLSDVAGSYAVSCLVIFVGACIGRMIPIGGARIAWWPAIPLAAVLSAALGYGSWRLHEDTFEPGPKVALVQGSIDIEMKYDPAQGQQIFDQYFGLSKSAVREHPDLDLIVWPETMFRYPWVVFNADFQPPKGADWTPADVMARS